MFPQELGRGRGGRSKHITTSEDLMNSNEHIKGIHSGQRGRGAPTIHFLKDLSPIIIYTWYKPCPHGETYRDTGGVRGGSALHWTELCTSGPPEGVTKSTQYFSRQKPPSHVIKLCSHCISTCIDRQYVPRFLGIRPVYRLCSPI